MANLACRNCGALIPVADDADRITCGHCGSGLTVRRTGAAAFTQRIEDVESRTGRTAQRLAEFRERDARLAAHEEDWQAVRRKFCGRGPGGRWEPPVPISNSLWKGICVGVGTAGLLVLGGAGIVLGSKVAMVTIPLMLVVGLLFGSIYVVAGREERASVEWVHGYEQQRSEYLERRRELLADGRPDTKPDVPREDRAPDDGIPELIALGCRGCGAPLDVPRDAKYVTCTHCDAQLAVQRTESVAYTERLGTLHKRATTLGDEVAELHGRTALELCDRDWELERQRIGGATPPVGGIVLAGIIGFSLVWAVLPTAFVVMAVSSQPEEFGGWAIAQGGFITFSSAFAVIGYGAATIALFVFVRGRRRVAAHRRAKAEYQSRRARLVGEESPVDAMERSHHPEPESADTRSRGATRPGRRRSS